MLTHTFKTIQHSDRRMCSWLWGLQIKIIHLPDFHMSRCACSVSPHWGERWRNSSSLMAQRSFPVSSWKAFPAWGNLYRCSVHSSHFCTFPVFHSMGSKKKQTGTDMKTVRKLPAVSCELLLVWLKSSSSIKLIFQLYTIWIMFHIIHLL